MDGLNHTPGNYAHKSHVNIYVGGKYGGISSGNATESKTAWIGIAVVAALGAIWCGHTFPFAPAVILITGLSVISLIALSKIVFDHRSDDYSLFKSDRGGVWDWLPFPRSADHAPHYPFIPPQQLPVRSYQRRRSLPHVEMKSNEFRQRNEERAPVRRERVERRQEVREQPGHGLGIDGKPLERMVPREERSL